MDLYVIRRNQRIVSIERRKVFDVSRCFTLDGRPAAPPDSMRLTGKITEEGRRQMEEINKKYLSEEPSSPSPAPQRGDWRNSPLAREAIAQMPEERRKQFEEPKEFVPDPTKPLIDKD